MCDTPPAKARRAMLCLGSYVVSHSLSLCWGTYVLGLIWLLLHPAITITTGELKCRETYVSENALLIDLMKARASDHEAQLAHNFHQKLLELPNLSPQGCSDNCSLVVDWIDAQLRELDRVEAYKHVFQTDAASQPRTNVYGILRASPLADGKESIVLVTHYRSVGADRGECSSLSLGLALLEYLARAKWLAKDVVLLAADDGNLDGSEGYSPGTDAWLQAYHLDPVDSGIQGRLPMRAGVIRAAINLETRGDSRLVNAVGLYTAGMNGQLPNLDLVNTAVRALRQHQMRTILTRAETKAGRTYPSGIATVLEVVSSLSQKYTPVVYKERVGTYMETLTHMLHFMTALATGPSGPHGHFISYNIDSLTLALTQSQARHDRPLATRDILRALEMIVRALSNLEEKLHQSFFLYVLPTPSTFVSVGEYIYAVLLVISPAFVHLLDVATHTQGMRVALALTTYLAIKAFCVLLVLVVCNYFASPTTVQQQSWSSQDPSATRWVGLASVIAVAQALILVVGMPALRSITSFSGCVELSDWTKRVTTQRQAQDATLDTKQTGQRSKVKDMPPLESGWRAIKFITMVELVFAHCIMGILNYPMALFGAVFMAHFARVVPISTTTVSKSIFNGLWLFVSSPLVLLILLLCSRQDAIAGLSYVVDSFALRINLLALVYTCCIYVSVHTLSLVIWVYPTADPFDHKQKLE